ncbi:hypothetical protein T484DRAFT_1960970 [Baffinella frigidus]|nr:hypothetical protein T484DRAFT_1960970 [Cryptophyta sp. CCMP2293]
MRGSGWPTGSPDSGRSRPAGGREPRETRRVGRRWGVSCPAALRIRGRSFQRLRPRPPGARLPPAIQPPVSREVGPAREAELLSDPHYSRPVADRAPRIGRLRHSSEGVRGLDAEAVRVGARSEILGCERLGRCDNSLQPSVTRKIVPAGQAELLSDPHRPRPVADRAPPRVCPLRHKLESVRRLAAGTANVGARSQPPPLLARLPIPFKRDLVTPPLAQTSTLPAVGHCPDAESAQETKAASGDLRQRWGAVGTSALKFQRP